MQLLSTTDAEIADHLRSRPHDSDNTSIECSEQPRPTSASLERPLPAGARIRDVVLSHRSTISTGTHTLFELMPAARMPLRERGASHLWWSFSSDRPARLRRLWTAVGSCSSGTPGTHSPHSCDARALAAWCGRRRGFSAAVAIAVPAVPAVAGVADARRLARVLVCARDALERRSV